MLFERTMMKRWMGIKSPEGIADSMKVMMPIMSKKMGSGGMAGMMPRLMDETLDMIRPEDMEKMIHEAMPKMMDHCFSKMDDSQRRSVLSMCRESLDRIEEKYLAASSSKDQ